MAFSALIQQMLSAQNEQRQAAEAVFAEVKSNADLTETSLLCRHAPEGSCHANQFEMSFQLSLMHLWEMCFTGAPLCTRRS